MKCSYKSPSFVTTPSELRQVFAYPQRMFVDRLRTQCRARSEAGRRLHGGTLVLFSRDAHDVPRSSMSKSQRRFLCIARLA